MLSTPFIERTSRVIAVLSRCDGTESVPTGVQGALCHRELLSPSPVEAIVCSQQRGSEFRGGQALATEEGILPPSF